MRETLRVRALFNDAVLYELPNGKSSHRCFGKNKLIASLSSSRILRRQRTRLVACPKHPICLALPRCLVDYILVRPYTCRDCCLTCRQLPILPPLPQEHQFLVEVFCMYLLFVFAAYTIPLVILYIVEIGSASTCKFAKST